MKQLNKEQLERSERKETSHCCAHLVHLEMNVWTGLIEPLPADSQGSRTADFNRHLVRYALSSVAATSVDCFV